MNKLYYFFLAICLSTMMISCGGAAFEIKGDIAGANNIGVYLDEFNFISSESMTIEKGETSGSGSFKIELEENPGKGYYRVRLGAKSAYLILDGSESRVNITGDLAEFNKFSYKVDGSTQTADFLDIMGGFGKRTKSVAEIQSFIQNEASAEIALPIALMLFGGSIEFTPLHVELSQKIKEAMPDESMANEYLVMADGMNKEYMRQQALNKVRIGEIAPDIELPGPDGKTRKLSDLRGNIVLLDFWASWCGPCRRDNPKVVKTYDKYKEKGFTVYSVSLDGLDSRTKQRFAASGQVDSQIQRSKQRWVDAIQKDNLKWDSHVSDLKKWDSKAAAMYGVRSIPQTYLIDRDGKIAAVNPRYNLEQAILQVI